VAAEYYVTVNTTKVTDGTVNNKISEAVPRLQFFEQPQVIISGTKTQQ
jgi:hypothetical protein